MTIIDRALGQNIPPGKWEAEWYQATHDTAGLDVGFASHWPSMGPVRGAYHFARPGASSGASQATLFVSRVKVCGWQPGKDLWMLDVEVDGLNGQALHDWIVEFMETAKASLGDRGFLYIGFPFYVTHVSHKDFSLLQRYRWWLPDFGPDDGTEHPIQGGEPFPPILHQYTMIPFDQSSIINRAEWDKLFIVPVPPVIHPPIDYPEESVKEQDITIKLDADGNGYFDLPNVSNAAIHSALVIGIPDPALGKYAKIPNVAFTLGGSSKVDRFVLVGGSPGQTVTTRVVYSG